MTQSNKSAANETQVVEGKDGSIKITQPRGSRKRSHVTVLLEPDDLVREQAVGFINFLREHAVVGLAVGFIIGLQAQTLMKQLVDSFITPLLNLWLGDVMSKQFTVSSGSGTVAFTWGKFIYSVVTFLFVLLFVYVIIKALKLDKLDKPKEKK